MNPQASATTADILRDRARRLAATPPRPPEGPALRVLEFALGEERYALELDFVAEVQRLTQLTQVPCTPRFYAGVINVRGRIIPVIDLKKLLGLPDKGIADLHCVLVLRDQDVELGLLADFVVGTREYSAEALQRPFTAWSGVRPEAVRGIAAGHVTVLHGAEIIRDPQLLVDETPPHQAAPVLPLS